VVNYSLFLEGKETDTFSGLASATAAANAIGSDTEPVHSTDPPLGTGLVQFHGAVPSGSSLPDDNQSFSLTDTTPHPVTTTPSGGSPSTLFEVVARQAPPQPINVTVELDKDGSTFTLTAEYDSGPKTVAFVDLTSNLPPALSFLFTVSPPASGFAVPAGGTVKLSGGDTSIPASGIAYTAVQPSPAPAIAFTAASPGVEGNNIAVAIQIEQTSTVSGPPTVVNYSLFLEGKETDKFSGLASATAAANAIGSDTKPVHSTDPPLGTGLVQFHAAGPSGSGLPDDNQSFSLTDTTPHPVTTTPSGGSPSTLFEVVARQKPPDSTHPINVTVNLDAGKKTFTLAAEYDSGPETVAFVDLTSNLPPALSFLFTVSPPASGFAIPAGGTVKLSGGDTGTSASGIAYTSAS
jgi:hypothetical protein